MLFSMGEELSGVINEILACLIPLVNSVDDIGDGCWVESILEKSLLSWGEGFL